MTARTLSVQHLDAFRIYLIQEEKSTATVEKYLRDASAFLGYLSDCPVTKEHTVAYKQFLQERGYTVRSINSMLASINSLLDFLPEPFSWRWALAAASRPRSFQRS